MNNKPWFFIFFSFSSLQITESLKWNVKKCFFERENSRTKKNGFSGPRCESCHDVKLENPRNKLNWILIANGDRGTSHFKNILKYITNHIMQIIRLRIECRLILIWKKKCWNLDLNCRNRKVYFHRPLFHFLKNKRNVCDHVHRLGYLAIFLIIFCFRKSHLVSFFKSGMLNNKMWSTRKIDIIQRPTRRK